MSSLFHLQQKIRNRHISVAKYIQDVITKVKEMNRELNCFLFIDEETSVKKAEKLELRLKRGGKLNGKLAGIPVAIKANICSKGFITSCGSKMLGNFVSPFDSTVVKKLKQQEAIIIGNTNMDEFAMGSSCEYSAFGPVKNPLNRDYVSGGSSGGSAAAVSAGLVVCALGSDTGGSVRLPAAFCGVVGLKPTYGLVSRYGLVAFASSLDQIGVIGNSVKDAFIILEIISGNDEKDSTSITIPKDFFSFLEEPEEAIISEARKMKIAAVDDSHLENCSPQVRVAFNSAMRRISLSGIDLHRIKIRWMELSVVCYYIIASAEAASNLARFDSVRYGNRVVDCRYEDYQDFVRRSRSLLFGPEVKRRILIGNFVLREGYYKQYYIKALRLRTIIANEFIHYFKKFDVVLSPVSPVLPFRFGERTKDPLSMYLIDTYTIPANLGGMPAISIPYGGDEFNLSAGIQAVAPPMGERKLYMASFLLEKIFNERRLP